MNTEFPTVDRCQVMVRGKPCPNGGDLYRTGVLFAYVCSEHAVKLKSGVRQWYRAES